VQTEGMVQFENKMRFLERQVVARKDVEQECDKMVEWFAQQKLNEKIQKELEEKMEREFGSEWHSMSFAVRSSAAMEDSSEMSAAGQMSTYLGVRGVSKLSAAVVRCWASQFAFVPIEYKRGYGQELNSPMAVVVQQMVDCHSAGVMFTANPTDADERILTLTANFGLGESVVSAAADPDTFLLAVDLTANSYQIPRTVHSIASKTLGKKSLVTRLNHDVTNVDDLESFVLNEKTLDGAQQQSISDDDAIRLGNIALTVNLNILNLS
jgi:phosphoenolpyruvate synthase/pyruvate phosphate dikinase